MSVWTTCNSMKGISSSNKHAVGVMKALNEKLLLDEETDSEDERFL